MDTSSSAHNGFQSIRDGEMNSKVQPSLPLVHRTLHKARFVYGEANGISSPSIEETAAAITPTTLTTLLTTLIGLSLSIKTSFTCFTDLPFVPRRKIWKFAFLGPRIFFNKSKVLLNTSMRPIVYNYFLPPRFSSYSKYRPRL